MMAGVEGQVEGGEDSDAGEDHDHDAAVAEQGADEQQDAEGDERGTEVRDQMVVVGRVRSRPPLTETGEGVEEVARHDQRPDTDGEVQRAESGRPDAGYRMSRGGSMSVSAARAREYA